jgi:hypothetical protein
MWYGNTKSLLESIVRGLKAEPPQNDAELQAQTDLVQACLAETVEMSEPTVHPSMGATSRYVHRPIADKLNRAMPHVRSMLTAMRDRDPTIPRLWRTARRPCGGSERIVVSISGTLTGWYRIPKLIKGLVVGHLLRPCRV